jgi:hypothetical protein
MIVVSCGEFIRSLSVREGDVLVLLINTGLQPGEYLRRSKRKLFETVSNL